MKKTAYRFEASSLEGAVQLLQIHLKNEFYFYVVGLIPEGNDPRQTDEKLIRQYRTDISKHLRCDWKAAGFFTVHYLRLGHLFVLLATHGTPPPKALNFFAEEATRIRDARETPIKLGGYAISAKPGAKVRVAIEEETYRAIWNEFMRLATRRKDPSYLAAKLLALPFEPYGPVIEQLFSLRKAMNFARKPQGLEPLPASAVRRYRRSLPCYRVVAEPFAWAGAGV